MKKLIITALVASFFLSCTNEKSACYDQQLVYIISQGKGNFDILRNDLKGGEFQLTTNPSWDYAPKWNTASASIIYYSYVADTFLTQRMDVNGQKLELDTYGQEEYNVSPDGKWLITQEQKGDFSQLVLSDIKGENRKAVTDSNAYNGRATWSPNSERIAYISDRDGNNEVYLLDIDRDVTTRLTNNETSEKYLTWAPDSEQIAFSTEYYGEGKPDRNDVFIMDLATKEIQQITSNEFVDSELAWSPAGDRIAFHSKRDRVDHIFTMNLDGSDVVQVSSQNKYHGEPEWVQVRKPCE